MGRAHEASLPGELGRVLGAYREIGEVGDFGDLGGDGLPAVSPLPGGLLHQSFAVSGRGVEYVLQRVHPAFSPAIHANIAAVTEHLHARGLLTLRLVATREGAPYLDLGSDGLWRLMTRVPGVTFDTCGSPEQARSAGALVARFHSALADLTDELEPLGFPFHDTSVHMEELRTAVEQHSAHRLRDSVSHLADEILGEVERWETLASLPARIIHGDLKFNNVLFAGREAPESSTAVSLIDLDTLARMPLYFELGDAWRSWCNRSGEDVAEAELDLEVFRASAEGYLSGLTLELHDAERASLVVGLERISLELAARFAADALAESYFSWDPVRFPTAGDHNLTRARGQLSLFRQACATRGERSRVLGL